MASRCKILVQKSFPQAVAGIGEQGGHWPVADFGQQIVHPLGGGEVGLNEFDGSTERRQG